MQILKFIGAGNCFLRIPLGRLCPVTFPYLIYSRSGLQLPVLFLCCQCTMNP